MAASAKASIAVFTRIVPPAMQLRRGNIRRAGRIALTGFGATVEHFVDQAVRLGLVGFEELVAIHDTMQYIRPKVGTVCIGQAASMGSFLLAAGEPGMRVALTNSRIMIHQPSGGAQGMASDIEIQAREILRMRTRLNTLYAKYTGQPIEEIEKSMDRDKFLEADEAKAYGLIDEVFDRRPDASEGDTTGAADITPA